MGLAGTRGSVETWFDLRTKLSYFRSDATGFGDPGRISDRMPDNLTQGSGSWGVVCFAGATNVLPRLDNPIPIDMISPSIAQVAELADALL